MTQNHIQGVFGEFQPVLDRAGGEFTQNQVQGVLGEFKPTLDIAQTTEEPPVGTNMKINISDVWKDIDSIKINIGDVWKDVTSIKQNIGDVWKDVF